MHILGRAINFNFLALFVFAMTVPNVFALFYFKKCSRKETVFNQSNGRKFENSLFAQENLLTEPKRLFLNFLSKETVFKFPAI